MPNVRAQRAGRASRAPSRWSAWFGNLLSQHHSRVQRLVRMRSDTAVPNRLVVLDAFVSRCVRERPAAASPEALHLASYVVTLVICEHDAGRATSSKHEQCAGDSSSGGKAPIDVLPVTHALTWPRRRAASTSRVLGQFSHRASRRSKAPTSCLMSASVARRSKYSYLGPASCRRPLRRSCS